MYNGWKTRGAGIGYVISQLPDHLKQGMLPFRWWLYKCTCLFESYMSCLLWNIATFRPKYFKESTQASPLFDSAYLRHPGKHKCSHNGPFRCCLCPSRVLGWRLGRVLRCLGRSRVRPLIVRSSISPAAFRAQRCRRPKSQWMRPGEGCNLAHTPTLKK